MRRENRWVVMPVMATVLWFLGFGLGLSVVAEGVVRGDRISVQWLGNTAGEGRMPLELVGSDARRQLVVTEHLADGGVRDVTRRARFRPTPEGVLNVDGKGFVTPAKDGAGSLVVQVEGGLTATVPFQVRESRVARPINFANQIVPVFTKAGCNGGGCHGKASGQNGFRLSLLGFEPTEDYEHLVKEARGRRLFPASPEKSLLLQKAIGALPHGGGKRMDPEGADYKLLVRWMRQGMPYGSTNDPVVTGVEVFPKERTLAMESEQQLIVAAKYSDGTVEDVTPSALFEPNNKEMARTGETGHVELFKTPGDVAVMVRYQSHVATFRAMMPLGMAIGELPPSRNLVDELVFGKLKKLGLPPSGLADDRTFLRRATLDIAGRLPTEAEYLGFVSEKGEGKRERLVERLVESEDYADFFANKWSALLRNRRGAPSHARGTMAFHAWVRQSLAENKPYDQLVREVVAASGDVAENPAVAWYRQVRETTTQLEDTAQLFLGTRIQCAQCHHHPYERWSQQDYYSLAAFFTPVQRKSSGRPGEENILARRGVPTATNKKTKQPVAAAGLGSRVAELGADDDARLALADWMARPDNPFFARALVNRYWKHFFGRGLVEPEDDLRETNPASNPELLDGLAREFVAKGFDLKWLVKTLASSSSYQLAAMPNAHNAIDRQNHSRFYPRRLQAEVLYDAIHQVLKAESQFEGLPKGMRAVALPDNSFNASSYFLTVFGRPDNASACECERSQDASLAQSLHLLNSKELQEKISSDKGLAAMLAADAGRTDEEKVALIYRTAMTREPTADELRLARQHFLRKVKDKEGKEVPIPARQAYEDILWALVNTKEFLFNH